MTELGVSAGIAMIILICCSLQSGLYTVPN